MFPTLETDVVIVGGYNNEPHGQQRARWILQRAIWPALLDQRRRHASPEVRQTAAESVYNPNSPASTYSLVIRVHQSTACDFRTYS